jgi:hypothetical protein
MLSESKMILSESNLILFLRIRRAKSSEFLVLSFGLAGKADWGVLSHWEVMSFELGPSSQVYT